MGVIPPRIAVVVVDGLLGTLVVDTWVDGGVSPVEAATVGRAGGGGVHFPLPQLLLEES